MNIEVDTGAVTAAGFGLQDTSAGAVGAAPHCPPAASDPVSVSAADALSTWSAVLWTLLEHAGRLRDAGGASVAAAAGLLGGVDTANARMIAGVADGGAVSAPDVPAIPVSDVDVPMPSVRGIPANMAPPPMSAEEIAAHVHAGPGTGHLRAFAEHWRDTVAPHILHTADETRRHGAAVDAHWDDGHQRAGSNIAEHADWLEASLHPSALRLADAAERVAEHTDTLIENTPHPEELRDLKQRYNTALADYRASGGLNAAPAVALGTQWDRTTDTTLAGYDVFAAAAQVNTNHEGPMHPPPAPPIVRADGPPAAPMEPPTSAPPRHHTGDAGGHGGAHGEGDGGEDPKAADAPASAPPLGPGGPPPAGPAQPVAVDTTATGTAANVAGTVMGAGIGTASQLANGLHGLTGASPMSALSGLSSLPGMGGGRPPMDSPSSPGDGGGGEPSPDPPGAGDFGTGGTSPASGGGDGGGGGAGAPMASPGPAVTASSAAGPTVGAPAAAATSPAGATPVGVGGGMFAPPMAGGMGHGGDEGWKSEDKRRVVHRPVPNTEPVFGEVERRRPSRKAGKQEDSS